MVLSYPRVLLFIREQYSNTRFPLSLRSTQAYTSILSRLSHYRTSLNDHFSFTRQSLFKFLEANFPPTLLEIIHVS
jgi:hypothetical protein